MNWGFRLGTQGPGLDAGTHVRVSDLETQPAEREFRFSTELALQRDARAASEDISIHGSRIDAIERSVRGALAQTPSIDVVVRTDVRRAFG
jgi:hypothetical protein